MRLGIGMFIGLFMVMFSLAAHAEVSFVDLNSFQVGQSWTWLYSEKTKDQQWTPYYIETYRVHARHQDQVTVEMSSRAAGDPDISPAHHKFIVDLKDCLKAEKDPHAQNWTVRFYSKSLSGNWQLVEANHPNLVFTEKFNCRPEVLSEPVLTDVALWQGEPQRIFQFPVQPRADSSWYFLEAKSLEGVTARKIFRPNGEFKMEFQVKVPAVQVRTRQRLTSTATRH